MRIGIFGGAFNPVHNGHINLADCYLRELELDRIIFIPTSVPPHKTDRHLVSPDDRINMLRLAVDGNPFFEISDIEFKRSGKSYTYDTILQLKEMYPDDEFFLIVGADQFFFFQQWYHADDILKTVTVCTAARNGDDEYNRLVSFKQSHTNMSNCIVSSFPVVTVSSSQIREMVNKGIDISHLVSYNVEKYIKDKNLYV